MALLGRDFRPYGYRENRRMVAAFCEEQWAQALVPKPLDPDTVFADFEAMMRWAQGLGSGGYPRRGAPRT